MEDRIQVRWWIRWWQLCNSNLGSPQNGSVNIGETCLFIQECESFSSERSTNTPYRDLCRCCYFHWIVIAQTRMETISGDSRSTAFDRFWPHVEGTGGEASLANIRKLTWNNVTKHMLCFWKDFSTALSSRMVIISDKSAVYRSPLTRNVIFLKQAKSCFFWGGGAEAIPLCNNNCIIYYIPSVHNNINIVI